MHSQIKNIFRPLKIHSPYIAIICCLSILITLPACSGKGYLKNPNPIISDLQDCERLRYILKHAHEGDWFLIRGYHQVDDTVSDLTGGLFSHASVYDKQKNEVIESDRTGVHTTKLLDFIQSAHRLIVIRPVWSNRRTSKKAVLHARELIGKPYNFTGVIGISTPDTYYCSQLVVEIYRPFFRKKDHFPPIITPLSLLGWGKVIYDSGARE